MFHDFVSQYLSRNPAKQVGRMALVGISVFNLGNVLWSEMRLQVLSASSINDKFMHIPQSKGELLD